MLAASKLAGGDDSERAGPEKLLVRGATLAVTAMAELLQGKLCTTLPALWKEATAALAADPATASPQDLQVG